MPLSTGEDAPEENDEQSQSNKQVQEQQQCKNGTSTNICFYLYECNSMLSIKSSFHNL